MVERGKAKEPKVKNVVWRNGLAYARKTLKGVEYTKPLGTRSSREAEKLAREWVVELVKTGGGPAEIPLFQDAVNHFTETHLPRVSIKTQKRYLTSLINVHEFIGGDQRLNDIGPKILSRYEADRRAAGISNPTIRRDLYTLSCVFNVFIEDEQWSTNPVLPFLRAAKRRGLTESEPRQRYLSLEEEGALLGVAKRLECGRWSEHRQRMLAYFIPLNIMLGGREGEMLSIKLKDIDLDREEIQIRKGKRGKIRTVPLLPKAFKLINEMLATFNYSRSPMLFHREDGSRIDDMYKPLQACARVAGIEDIQVHDLRRTCGVRLLRGIGVAEPFSMEEVSIWLGHTSIKVTERVYAFLSVDELHRAARTKLGRKAEKTRYIDAGQNVQLIEYNEERPLTD